MSDGFPDAARIERYTRGQCWLLAMALTARTGWPAFERTFHYPGLGQYEHAYVRVPDGRWLDAEGVHPETFADESPMNLDRWILRHAMLGQPGGDLDMGRALADAGELLEITGLAELR